MCGTSYSDDTVCRRIRRFQSVKKDPRDEATVWNTQTVMNENAIELRHAIAHDPQISIREITEICYLSHRRTIHQIIYDELGMKEVLSQEMQLS